MNRLAVVPARGGSKRIPQKNIRLFAGRPMLHHPVRAALESGLFDEVMVSTEDAEISAVAREAGAEVPFLRSPATASDTATLADVLLEVLAGYRRLGRAPAVVCCLLPTAVFVTPEMLRQGWQRLETSHAPGVVAVTRFGFPVQRALAMDVHGGVRMMWPQHTNTRSQDLAPAFHDAGQFYWARVAAFEEHRSIWMPGALGHVLPSSAVQDVDTEEDWQQAEFKHAWLSRPR